ncbi:MAG: saccharopine dehydrogenase NADP-binding domain-containing protein [Nitrospira sp.]|nr:saccharopine dehydrogenase NADP-binding domain-containing protein [Nitrospira sp.]
MRIFVLGVGATGSYLVKLLLRQGHHVTCGDRDPERARRFLGTAVPVAVERVNGRNRWSIIKASRGAQLIVNMLPSVCNRTTLRAALHIRAHYLDTAAHLTKSPFRAEQLQFTSRFMEKRRTAVITAGVAPGLTNLLAAAAADSLDEVEAVRVRLYESTESEQPVSQWSAEVSFDEAVSRPRLYRDGRFLLGRRFGEREMFRFPAPIGSVPVMLAAQDEVVTLPHVIPLRSMDAKIGGSDIERLRRWYRQGKLRKSRGLVAARFPRTPTPGTVDRLIRRGILHNAHFAAAVVVEGVKAGRRMSIRWDATMPSLSLLYRQGELRSPIAWATARMASLFVKHFPRNLTGVHAPEALPQEVRRAILRDVRMRGFRIVKHVTVRARRSP